MQYKKQFMRIMLIILIICGSQARACNQEELLQNHAQKIKELEKRIHRLEQQQKAEEQKNEKFNLKDINNITVSNGSTFIGSAPSILLQMKIAMPVLIGIAIIYAALYVIK